MAADLVVGRQRAGEHDPDPALLEHVRGAVADAGHEAGVGDLLEAERVDVEVRGLKGVADVELDVVDAVQRHEVVAALGFRGDDGLGAHGRSSLWLKFGCFMVALSSATSKRNPLRSMAQ